MPLSNEDSLRLNVLCAQTVKAIRINESSMLLTALTDRGEARIELQAEGRHEPYLREVRNFLSEKYLNMPGGYPRHLERWTRMGVSNHSADKMLLLGEQEAIVAMACSGNISAEMAGYAWWAYQSPEIARNLLKSTAVAKSPLGPELAQFLLEFLPFEERSLDIVDSVRQCLQGQLLDAQHKAGLWERAQRKNPYVVGFLLAGPQSIPYTESAHADYRSVADSLNDQIESGNLLARVFVLLLSGEGRKWLKSLSLALKKPTEPEVVIALFIAIDQTIDSGLFKARGVADISQAITHAESLCSQPDSPAQIVQARDKLNTNQLEQLKAVLVLAQLGENTLNKIFGGRDATGTVMRKHLKPLSTQINTTIDTLLS